MHKHNLYKSTGILCRWRKQKIFNIFWWIVKWHFKHITFLGLGSNCLKTSDWRLSNNFKTNLPLIRKLACWFCTTNKLPGFYMDEKKVIKRLPFNILNPCSAVFQLELEQVYLLAPLTFIYNVHKCTTLPRCYSNGLWIFFHLLI